MNDSLKLAVIITAIILFLVITYILKKGRIPIKYALVWYFSALIILITATFPILMTSLAHLVGFETLSNMVLCALILMLMFITLVLTIIVAGQTTKIRMLIQEVSILKSEMEKNKK